MNNSELTDEENNKKVVTVFERINSRLYGVQSFNIGVLICTPFVWIWFDFYLAAKIASSNLVLLVMIVFITRVIDRCIERFKPVEKKKTFKERVDELASKTK